MRSLILAALLAASLFPVGALLYVSVSDPTIAGPSFEVAHATHRAREVYGDVLLDRVFWSAARNSVFVAGMTGLTSTLWATVLAVMLKLRYRRGTRLFVFFVLLGPLFANYYLRTFASRVLMSEGNPVDQFLHLFFGREHSANLMFTWVGTWIHLTLSAVPYAFIPLFIALEGVSDSELVAARNLGAGGLRLLREFLWPAAGQGGGIGFTFAFVFAISDHIASAMIGGGNFVVLPALPIDWWKNSDFARAAAVGLLSWPPTLAVTWLVLRVVAKGARTT